MSLDEYTPLLNEQQFVNYDANLRGEIEERAGGHSYLERWSLLTRHGSGSLGVPNGHPDAKSLTGWNENWPAASDFRL